MKRKITGIIIFCICQSFAKGQIKVPDSILQTIEGDTIQLKQYQGKKLMIVVIPISRIAENSMMLLKMDSVSLQYKDSINFIAVPSYEDGYVDSLNAYYKAWYKDILQLNFTITTGMFTRNSSGSQQSWLFQWLSNENLNGHFGTDITTQWQKFLLNQVGELKAVFDVGTELDSRLMNFILGM